jgi:Tol biopolymer transport system component
LEWSPDGDHLGYSFIDSTFQVGVVSTEGSGGVQEMGEGFLLGWLDGGSSVNVIRAGTSWRVPLDGSPATPVAGDSVIVRSGSKATYNVVQELSGGRTRYYVKENGKSRLLHEGGLPGFRWHPDGDRILFEKDGAWWMLWVASGKQEPYPWKNPDVVVFSDISPDGERTVFVRDHTQSKLILIDNFME